MGGCGAAGRRVWQAVSRSLPVNRLVYDALSIRDLAPAEKPSEPPRGAGNFAPVERRKICDTPWFREGKGKKENCNTDNGEDKFRATFFEIVQRLRRKPLQPLELEVTIEI